MTHTDSYDRWFDLRYDDMILNYIFDPLEIPTTEWLALRPLEVVHSDFVAKCFFNIRL